MSVYVGGSSAPFKYGPDAGILTHGLFGSEPEEDVGGYRSNYFGGRMWRDSDVATASVAPGLSQQLVATAPVATAPLSRQKLPRQLLLRQLCRDSLPCCAAYRLSRAAVSCAGAVLARFLV